MLQRYLDEYRVSEGTVIVNYFYDDADGNQKTLTDTITINGRVGDPFTTSKYYVMGYQLDESRLPKVTEGMIRFGAPLYVNYYYILGSPDVNLHFKHSGSLAWAPTLWVWGSGLDGKDAGNYSGGTWPGRAATLNEETGWYDYDFTFTGAGTYNVIVSNGGKTQTVDCKGFGYNESVGCDRRQQNSIRATTSPSMTITLRLIPQLTSFLSTTDNQSDITNARRLGSAGVFLRVYYFFISAVKVVPFSVVLSTVSRPLIL